MRSAIFFGARNSEIVLRWLEEIRNRIVLTRGFFVARFEGEANLAPTKIENG
jgi:hypothetical protein